jgi:hypothetical protein
VGSSRLISSEEESRVESISLTKIFEECCPIYMGYGMSYDEYWFDTPYKAKFYREMYDIQVKRKDEEFWMQGVYIYDALCKVAPILHAFSKAGTKPLPYPDKPYLSSKNNEEVLSEEDKEKKLENERLIAQVHFNTWFRAVSNHFKNK